MGIGVGLGMGPLALWFAKSRLREVIRRHLVFLEREGRGRLGEALKGPGLLHLRSLGWARGLRVRHFQCGICVGT